MIYERKYKSVYGRWYTVAILTFQEMCRLEIFISKVASKINKGKECFFRLTSSLMALAAVINWEKSRYYKEGQKFMLWHKNFTGKWINRTPRFKRQKKVETDWSNGRQLWCRWKSLY